MEYQIIFDASEKPFNWQFSASDFLFALVIFVVSVGLLFAKNRWPSQKIPASNITGGFIGSLFCFAWAIVAFSSTYNNYQTCQNALDTNTYSVIEGVITDFQPSSNIRGKPPEQFTVNGVTFKYKDGLVSCGYTQTTGGRGVLQNGVRVRVSYLPQLKNTIVRLEIRE